MNTSVNIHMYILLSRQNIQYQKWHKCLVSFSHFLLPMFLYINNYILLKLYHIYFIIYIKYINCPSDESMDNNFLYMNINANYKNK